MISQGIKTVNTITGTGDTFVVGSGTVLNATSIVQGSLTIGGPAPAPVPEPNALVLLAIAALSGAGLASRKRKR